MQAALRIFRSHWKMFVLVLAALIVGGAVGWYAHEATPQSTFHAVRETAPDYKFIAPFLYLEAPESTLPAYLGLKTALQKNVDDAITAKQAADISVYVRDMNSGQWVAINPDHKFALASMLKVVTIMTVLHQAEVHPSTLADSITISPAAAKEVEPQAYAPPLDPVQLGVPYTLDQLFWHDIVESDNVAENALESFIGLDTIKQTYTDLHLPIPPTTSTDIDTPQEYSHLFRVLYGATYLSRENSQALLDLLSRTTFTQGLVAGVPPGVIVSHKFGENYVPESGATNAPVWHELHDCGIVYHANAPYFVCVTTKGDDFPTLANVIKTISATTWQHMDAIAAK